MTCHANRIASAIAIAAGLLASGAAAAVAAPVHTHAGHHRAAAHQAHTCGEYMFWHDGKCVDARDRGSGPWSDYMAKRSMW